MLNVLYLSLALLRYHWQIGLRCTWVGKIPWRRAWHPTPVLLSGKSHGRRSLVGCSPWGRWGSDMTEWLHFDFSLSCIGEGNGNPLQCSCLENPRDGGAWWAAICGVAQSRTRLKWLSSSSSSMHTCKMPSCFDTCVHCEMISTVNLINIFITSHFYILFLWWEHIRFTLFVSCRYTI